MKRPIGIAILFSLSLAAWAGSPEAARKRVELTMLITGTVDVAADGTVRTYTLDREDKLPPTVVDRVHRSAQGWRFRPISLNGTADDSRFNMSLRVIANRQDDGSYVTTLAGATFDNKRPNESVSVREITPPTYPLKARQARLSGTVYALLRVNKDGHVSDAAAAQVNLEMIGTDSELKERRAILAQAALVSAKQWTFNVPTMGPEAANDHWIVRVPVNFQLMRPGESMSDFYGRWLPYVPGPKQTIPWLDQSLVESDSSLDAVAGGQIHEVYGMQELITPLDAP